MMVNALCGFGVGGGFGLNRDISVNSSNYNIKAAAIAAGWDQIAPLTAIITINPGVVVGSTSVSTAAIDSGTTFPVGSTLTIINNGTIKGKGGNGANCRWVSASSGYWAYNGGKENGGTAIKTTIPTTVINNGVIAGGGGGGAYIGGYVGDSSSGGEAGGGGAGADVGAAANLSLEYAGVIAWSTAGNSTGGGAGTSYSGTAGPSGGALGAAGGNGTYYTYGGGSVPTAGGAAGKYIEGIALTTWSGTAGVGGSS